MFLNAVYSAIVIGVRIFNLTIAFLCLITLYKCWQYVRERPYRKHGGENTVCITVFLSLSTVVLLVIDFAVNEDESMERRGCIFIIGFEIYQLLTVFCWFLIRIITLESSLRMYNWPSPELGKRCVIAYVTPGIMATITCGILLSRSTYLQVTTPSSKDAKTGTIDSCDVDINTETRALVGCLVVAPIFVVTAGYTIQVVRCLMVANTVWDAQHFTLRQKFSAFLQRRNIIRGIINILTLVFLTSVTMALGFTAEESRRSVKIIYSTIMSSMVSMKVTY